MQASALSLDMSPLAVLQRMLDREASRTASLIGDSRSPDLDPSNAPLEVAKRLENLLLNILGCILGKKEERTASQFALSAAGDSDEKAPIGDSSTATSLWATGDEFPDDEKSSVVVSSSDLWRTFRMSPALARMICVISHAHSLLVSDRRSSKRDVYYENKRLFSAQRISDHVLERICALINVPAPYCLNIIPAERGRVRGEVTFFDGIKNVSASCRRTSVDGIAIPPRADKISHIRVDPTVKYCLVIEKEAIFTQLSRESFCTNSHCVIITAMGYPDVATRSFLNKLGRVRPAIPIFCLTDGDADGIGIFLTYKDGSATMRHAFESLSAPSMRWLGVFPSEITGERSASIIRQQHANFQQGSPQIAVTLDSLLPLSTFDRQKLSSMTNRLNVRSNSVLVREIQHLQHHGAKVEIQCLTSTDASFLGRYINAKIAQGRWA